MTYLLNDTIITINIIYKNNKNIYFRFKDENTLEVTCNRFVSNKKILQTIKENENKFIKMLAKSKSEANADNYYWYLGKKYFPQFDESFKKVEFDGEYIKAMNEKALSSFTKKEIKRIFESEVERILPEFDNIPEFSLRIRFMKTRWGVCNRGNNTITLNSELIKKDLDLLDYVIIHEICHFYEANHSDRFWYQVGLRYPKYKEARKRLRGD